MSNHYNGKLCGSKNSYIKVNFFLN